MQQHAAAFFSPWDPPPSYTEAPHDSGLAQRITKLAEFAARNGPSFVEMMKERQKDNPEYAFLHGGEGTEYYRWCLYCHLYNHPREQPLPGYEQAAPPQQQAGGTQPAPSAEVPGDTSAALSTLPQEVSSGFQQVLSLLSGSRDSIKASQGWFMACVPYAAGMAEMMLQHVMSSADYQQQQHVLYLANDILLKARGQRAEGSAPSTDSVAEAFRPRLGRMLARTYQTGGKTDEVQQSLARVVNFWAERGVYDHETVERLTMEMLGISLTAPPQQAQQAEQPAPPLDPVVAAVAAAKAAALAAAAAINRAAGMPSQPPAASAPPPPITSPLPASQPPPHPQYPPQHAPPPFMHTSQPQGGPAPGPLPGGQQPPFPPPHQQQQQWGQYPPSSSSTLGSTSRGAAGTPRPQGGSTRPTA